MCQTISKVLFIVLSLLSKLSFAQEVIITEIHENPIKAVEPESFDYIDSGYVLNEDRYVATLSGFVVNSGQSVLSSLFNSFWAKANELGANSYRIERVENSEHKISVYISVYNLSDSQFEEMILLYPQNMVYVIGDIDKRRTPKKIKFNNEKFILAPMEFISYQNKVGENAVLSIGGFLGAKASIKGQEDRLPMHLSLSGFNVGPDRLDQLSLSFNTGRIYPIDLNFGQFLVNVLTEKE